MRINKAMFADPYFFPYISSNIARIGNANVSLMLKNASTSIKKLCDKHGYGYGLGCVSDFFPRDDDFVVDVYFRNPVDRYFSALQTVLSIHSFKEQDVPLLHTVIDKWDHHHPQSILMDPHFQPQYWYLNSLYVRSRCSNRLYFRFHDFVDISAVLGDINLNQSGADKTQYSAAHRTTIKHRYFYDCAIYNHFVGKTVNYEELTDQLSEILLGNQNSLIIPDKPLYAHYISKSNPKNSREKVQEKFDQYNQALEQIENICRKTKKY